MAAASASAMRSAFVVNNSPRAVGSRASATCGKPVAATRATRATARSTVTRAVVTPPQTHDNARPDTTLRPVSAAAVDSSKALEQFRNMGGASRESSLPYLSFPPPRGARARPGRPARDAKRPGSNARGAPAPPPASPGAIAARVAPRNPEIFPVSGTASGAPAARGAPPGWPTENSRVPPPPWGAPAPPRPLTPSSAPSTHRPLPLPPLLNRTGYASEAKSSIVSIGLSIHTCPVEVREKMAVPEDKWEEAVAQLCAYPHVEEAGILSTCNRMEIYVVALSWHRGVREVEEWMSQYSGIPLEDLREHLFLLRDQDATSHLLKVSGGLDSVVMGEGQILAQVKNVFALGENVPGFGRHLSGLFKAAITAGKRVRSETSIASGAVSVSSAAAELVQMKLPSGNFDGCRVMIVGAGTMSRLLVKHLVSKRCTEMTVVNRSAGRVEELQADFPEANIKLALMDEFKSLAAEHDVIFTAASTGVIIDKADLAAMAPANESVAGQRRLVDIAVPRNVDADCAEDDNTIVYNVDDLKELVELNKDKRERAADEARELLAHEQASFEAWRDSLETVPTIKRLRGKAENIRAAELEKAMGKLGDGLTKKQMKAVEELSRGIVNKLLHGPMQALRSDGTDPAQVSQTLVNMHALETMFDLKNQNVPQRGRK